MCVRYIVKETTRLYGIVQGIDVNPKKVEAIEKLQPPQTRKEIQKLAGMLPALSRFISKLDERGMPFYKLLQKADGFQFDD
jgi:hypothetical protein